MEQTHGGVGPGLIAQLRALAELGLRSVTTRLRLAQAELQADKDRLFVQLIWTMLAIFLGVFGLFLGVIGLVLMAPQEWRPAIMVSVSALFILACIVIAWRLHQIRLTEPDLLTDTLEVLEQDANALVSPAAQHEAQS